MATPQNLQYLKFNDEVAAVLHASRTTLLTPKQWKVLFDNKDLFPVINATTIPTLPLNGLYRVDCLDYIDSNPNVWMTHYFKHNGEGGVEFDVEASRTQLVEDFSDEDNEGSLIQEKIFCGRWVVRNVLVYPPQVTFVHFFYPLKMNTLL